MMGTIKQIDTASVHRICSGQVVIDLATATKELLENSLDAGATSIVIKFKNYGLDLIEVGDDGSGISSEDYDQLGSKHYTSKLSTFENLDDLETFGFRGEALSSLCALADVNIITATREDAPRATRLEFDHNGVMVNKKVASAKRGTSVSVANLFSTLPVRRKEFSKNCKREFAKAITLLQGYALICTNVKISVFHQPPNGKNALQLSTSGNRTIRENITNVFGAKILTSLEPLNLTLEIDVRHIGGKRTTETVEVIGYVSKSAHGEGRSSADRQFFYINSRSCNQPKIARTFNEIFRSYNSHQYPFILADFRLASGTYDLNLTPDKRTILLHDEQALLKELSEQLTQFYDSFQHNFPLSQFLTSKTPRRTERIKAESPDSQPGLQQLSSEEEEARDPEFGISQTPHRQPPVIDLSSVEKTVSNVTGEFKDRLATYALDSPDRVRSLDATLTPAPEVSIQQASPTRGSLRNSELEEEMSDDEDEEASDDDGRLVEQRPLQSLRRTKRTLTTVITPSQLERIIGPSKRSRSSDAATEVQGNALVQTSLREHFIRKADRSEVRGQGDNITFEVLSQDQVTTLLTDVAMDEIAQDEDDEEIMTEDVLEEDEVMVEDNEEQAPPQNEEEMEDIPDDPHESNIPLPQGPPVEASAKSERDLFKSRQRNAVHNIQTTTNITLDTVRSQHQSLQKARTPSNNRGTIASKEYAVPNEKAEERLSLTVSKEDFSRMRIVGQFNLGFIIAVRERHVDANNDIEDVFIIDQHASDEKYNFERLQAETVMQVQTLARPQQLELTAMEEAIVLDHLDIFKLNGFDIRPSLEDSPGKRCHLHAIPMSGNTVFSLSDLEELIHLIQLHPDKTSVRCSKARAMFAMRACRSSIMIGKALSGKMMEKVVRNLGGLDKPWSCPHGRPTMRHLTQLEGWTSWDADVADLED